MEAAKFELTREHLGLADIVAQGRDGRMVLIVEVKATELKSREAKQETVSQLKSYLQVANINIPFAMLVDLEDIEIFQGDNSSLSPKLIASLKTMDVLCHYDTEFGTKRIFELYLTALVEAWLRDLAYHWKSEKPPASEQLAAIGLLQQLEGGTTQLEVSLNGNTVR
ncbi:MAG: type I restriction enzyme HsdR N-terminal domain-containing protein [Microcoleus sp. SIO2G3]|nr:type I restriction enzyme HsdR N-terminal domain-containing protein [Microcoleus sp. SIO2G3]